MTKGKDTPSRPRILGINVARALAVAGMIIVNFKIVFGDHGDGLIKTFAKIFDGKAAAIFVVLAGIGLALMTNSAVKNQNLEKLKIGKKRIIKRAIFLFIVGLSYIWIWPADILHFYGIYMLITLFFINRSSKQIFIGLVSLIFLYPILIVIFNYEIGWNFEKLEYLDFWTINGFFRNLFYNGFHPVIPWSAFMLFGLWYGRQDLYNEKFIRKSLRIGFIVFSIIQILSIASIRLLSNGDAKIIKELVPILGTEPMPPMPIYMINGISISVVIISSCILIANRYKNNKIISVLNKTGQLALSFYVAHVILGMGLIEEFGSLKFGEYTITFSVAYALIFSLACVLFAEICLRYFKSGPLEWCMRKLTD